DRAAAKGTETAGDQAPRGAQPEHAPQGPDRAAVDALFDNPAFVRWFAEVGGEEAEDLSRSMDERAYARLEALSRSFAVKEEAAEGLRKLWEGELGRFFGISPDRKELAAITESVAGTLDRWAFSEPEKVQFLKKEIDDLAAAREDAARKEGELAEAGRELQKLEEELERTGASRSGLQSEWSVYKKSLASLDGIRRIFSPRSDGGFLKTWLGYRDAIKIETKTLEALDMRRGMDLAQMRQIRELVEGTRRRLASLSRELLAASLGAPRVREMMENLATRRMEELLTGALSLGEVDEARRYFDKVWGRFGVELFGRDIEVSEEFAVKGQAFFDDIAFQSRWFAEREIQEGVEMLSLPTLSALTDALQPFLSREQIGLYRGARVKEFVMDVIERTAAGFNVGDPRRILVRRLVGALGAGGRDVRGEKNP
ncbi:MAG: hypothetical protein HY536_00420, partial [Candidatus Colwellbacteria bacterium]|nr:hypothetical protein [Candidatus Colwellbacteria bacterium]